MRDAVSESAGEGRWYAPATPVVGVKSDALATNHVSRVDGTKRRNCVAIRNVVSRQGKTSSNHSKEKKNKRTKKNSLAMEFKGYELNRIVTLRNRQHLQTIIESH
jgi:hypothetical protein